MSEEEWTYSSKTEARNKAFVEETVGEKSNGRDSVNYGENIVELERSFPWFVVRLYKTKSLLRSHPIFCLKP